MTSGRTGKVPGAEDFRLRVGEAEERIRRDIIRTPLETSEVLSRLTGADIGVKWESRQVTGSFKFRGALNRTRTFSPRERAAGLVTASTGNHGLAVAQAARVEGLKVEVFVPSSASREKLRRLRSSGVDLRLIHASCDKVEAEAREEARRSGRAYISPYNDLEVIFGQGTIGLEILGAGHAPQAVLIPVGGGGLASGVAGFLKSVDPDIRAYGVEPETSRFMAASLQAGRLVDVPEGETLADAVAGGIEPGSMTFPLCHEFLDGILTVSEASLRRAVGLLGRMGNGPVEGAGALPLAAVLEHGVLFRGQRTVLLVSGGNIEPALFESLISD